LPRRIVAALTALVVALVVVGYVVWRDADRPGSRFTIVSGPLGHIEPVVLPRTGMRFRLRPTDVTGRGRVLVQAGTYLQPARDTITFTIFGTNHARIARCVFPPGAYRDNDQLACAVPDIGAVRSLRATRTGNAKVALSASGDTVGFLALEEQRSLLGRVSTVISRIATPLPNGIGSSITLLGLFGSVVLTLLALLLAPWPASRDDDDAPGDRPSPSG
jgi:hypothetical protein